MRVHHSYHHNPILRKISFIILQLTVFTAFHSAYSQCPVNIDFESGNLNGWTCYSGTVAAVGGQNVITLSPTTGPVNDQHTIYRRNSGVDPYGGFPVTSPNGSEYSVKLGNDMGGGLAEGISYEFTIPANKDKYTLIYNYAVVFQDPNHQIYQQPRMEIEITNVTDNQLINCSSFTFVPNGSLLPGFFISPNSNNNAPVWCKDWTSVSINLDGNAGKTIKLFFKTADCTFQRHFGYAYIDVNSECSGEFVGATFCRDDSSVNVIAPPGYQRYTWYDSTLQNIIGNSDILTLTPPPPSGSTIAVTVEPFSGYGCPQTLYAKLVDTLTIVANAGIDALSCNSAEVSIGSPPKQGLVYTWSPAAGLSDATIANPYANPEITTNYILTVRSSGGGCADTDTVLVRSSILRNSMAANGKTAFCFGSGDSAVLYVPIAERIQWYKNNIPIPGATSNRYVVQESGTYYAMLYDNLGCVVSSDRQEVIIEVPRTGIRYPVQYAVENQPLTLESRKFGRSVLWNPEVSLNNPRIVNPVFTGAREQLYTIEIESNAGCITTDTLLVVTVKNADILVPSAFTPNSDGKNDILKPTLMGIRELTYFRVFSRWGELLFETKQNGAGWNGKVKGVPMATGTIIWIAEGVGVDNKVYTRKGTTVLIK